MYYIIIITLLSHLWLLRLSYLELINIRKELEHLNERPKVRPYGK